MAYIEFNDSLKLGNKLIDQEHAVLIEYINLLQTEHTLKVDRKLADFLADKPRR